MPPSFLTVSLPAIPIASEYTVVEVLIAGKNTNDKYYSYTDDDYHGVPKYRDIHIGIDVDVSLGFEKYVSVIFGRCTVVGSTTTCLMGLRGIAKGSADLGIKAWDVCANNDCTGETNSIPLHFTWTSHTFKVSVGEDVPPPNGPLKITTQPPLDYGVANSPYKSLGFAAKGGSPPYAWSFTGKIPPGMTLTSNGLLKGTPNDTGPYTFTVQVTDSAGATASAEFILIVRPAFSFKTGPNLPTATVMADYQVSLEVIGSSGTVAFALTPDSSLPPGLELAGGVIAGTPTEVGSYGFSITATDSDTGAQVTQTFSLNVTSKLAFLTPEALPDGTRGVPYPGVTLQVSGASGNVAFAPDSGSKMPPGLTLSSSGAIAGTPTESGSYSFTVSAFDAADSRVRRTFTLQVVDAPPLTITNPPPQAPGLGNFKGGDTFGPVTFTATGGIPPYTWTMSGVPNGLKLSDGCATGAEDCVLSGTFKPQTGGPDFYFSKITVTDNSSPKQSKSITVTVGVGDPPPVPMFDNTGEDTAYVGFLYTYNFERLIVGGAGPYSCTPSGDQILPDGIKLVQVNGYCLLAGIPTTAGEYVFTVSISDNSQPDPQTHTYTLYLHIKTPRTSGQTPKIDTSGVTNLGSSTSGITFGGLGTIRGQNLSDSTYTANGASLPPSLGPTRVLINGRNAPIVYASPNQITFQAPLDPNVYYPPDTACLQSPPSPSTYAPLQCPALQPASVVVVRDDVPSDGATVPVNSAAPGVLTYTRKDGITDPVILTAGDKAMVTPATPVSAGDSLIVYGTGIGIPMCHLVEGQPGGSNCLANPVPNFTFPDYPGIESNIGISYAGMAPSVADAAQSNLGLPGAAGLAQFNLALPAILPDTATAAGSIRMRIGDPSAGQTFTVYLKSSVPPLTITTTSLASGKVGVAYRQALNASGGAPPYSWGPYGNILAFFLPSGLAGSSDGVISGIPSKAGTYIVQVYVTDSAGARIFKNVVLTIDPAPLTITTTSLPPGQVGAAYRQALSASGGAPPYSWGPFGNILANFLPPGLDASPAGLISGTPTKAGTYTVQIGLSDSAGAHTTKNFVLTINPGPLDIATTSLPPGQVGVAYNQTVTGTGGVPPYSWTFGTGVGFSLPPGLNGSSTGAISGIPTKAETYNVLVGLSDSAGGRVFKSVSLAITVVP